MINATSRDGLGNGLSLNSIGSSGADSGDRFRRQIPPESRPHNYPAVLFVISRMIVLREGGLKVRTTRWRGVRWHGKMASADKTGESKTSLLAARGEMASMY